MATHAQIHAILDDSTARALKMSVIAACIKKAAAIAANGASTAGAISWAKDILRNPDQLSTAVYNFVIADNAAATNVEIRSLSDVAVQTSVDKAVDTLLSK